MAHFKRRRRYRSAKRFEHGRTTRGKLHRHRKREQAARDEWRAARETQAL